MPCHRCPRNALLITKGTRNKMSQNFREVVGNHHLIGFSLSCFFSESSIRHLQVMQADLTPSEVIFITCHLGKYEFLDPTLQPRPVDLYVITG